ncbi:NEAT domain-containing protein [Lentilactobacillus kisonensis]|nr:NEAT domain-containing protein [Lentilactobacillus kisonensis]
MKSHFLHGFKLLFFVTAFIFLGGIFANSAKAAPANLTDGNYTVPMKLWQKADPTQSSVANQFFDPTASVNVSQGNYFITLKLVKGVTFINSMTIGDQTVSPTVYSKEPDGGSGMIAFTQANPDEVLPVDFSLQVPLGPNDALIPMNQWALFDFSWSQATKISNNTPVTPNVTPNNGQVVVTPPSQTSAATTPTSTSSSTPAKPVAVSAKVTPKKAKVPTTTRTYVVLKGSSNSKSMANKYYTRKATIQKVNKHYNVQLKVSYNKSLKLGSKAVRPVTINNRKVKASTVKFGQTSKTYTMTYSFNVASFKTLKHLIKGSIHVTVPYMKISQTFPIRFKFSQKAPAKAHKAAKIIASNQQTTDGRVINAIGQ